LVAGLYFPIPAAAIGLAIIIGRFLYAAGYASQGASGRGIGVLINDLGLLGLFGLSIASGVFLIQGRSSL
jgi:glutathione S-transferase